MRTLEYTRDTGKIKKFSFLDEVDILPKLSRNKPSTNIFYNKKRKKAFIALEKLQMENNHSWYQEIKERASKDPTATALFYRGTKVSFEDMLSKADEVAIALANAGIVKGDEIPCCLANTPELVYILLAANKIGAKVNLFGTDLNKEYLSEILDSCSRKLLIVSDNNYGKIKDVVETKQYNKKVMYSLANSLPENPELCDEYKPKLDKYYHYDNLVPMFKENDNSIIGFDEFVSSDNNKQIDIIDNNDLDTEFLVTYTSGSTNVGHPSQMIHTNRSLIVSGRFHDAELSGNPEIKGLRGLAHIHPESNTDIITCISDNLMQLWSVGLEPEYDKNKALDYVLLNEPNYLNMTTSFLVQMAKDYLFNRKGEVGKMPFLFAAFAVGEGTSKGEEKLINKMLRKSRAGSGVKVAGIKLPYTTLSVGGGDCEHGGIYYTLWKKIRSGLNYLRLEKREYGLMPEPFVQVSAFKKISDDIYEECNYNEYGIIGANSITTMEGYKNDKEKTLSLIMRDTNGRDWISSKVLGYIDELGGVHVCGRVDNNITLSNGNVIPTFLIEKYVCEDTKNVLSCTVTKTSINNIEYPILNIELQPDKQKSNYTVMKSIRDRLVNRFGINIVSEFNYRLMSFEESYPLSGSGKRSTKSIEDLGLENVRSLYDWQELDNRVLKEKTLEKKY